MKARCGLGVIWWCLFVLCAWAFGVSAQTVTVGGVKILIDHNSNAHANQWFYFGDAPRPSTRDAATSAAFSILDGQPAPRSGGLQALHDGWLPAGADRPDQNFFFKNGTDGGLIRIDLGQVTPVQAVNSYSCHPSNRAPQIYTLYGSDGEESGFVLSPQRGSALEKQGWRLIASIATSMRGDFGGQWAVSVSGASGSLGRFRYLLFDIRNPELNTFYSEIDVIKQSSSDSPSPGPETIEVCNAGRYRVVMDTSNAPEITDWAHRVLVPVAKEWYPKIAQMLASPGFEAPTECAVEFRDLGPVSDAPGQIVAFTQGTTIICRAEWFRQNTAGEAGGCVVHEMVHVVQQYPQQQDAPAQEGQLPIWLVEGIADYIRWFLFEPQSHGADITAANLSAAQYDASYRITGNFLNWVAGQYGTNVIARLNAAGRKSEYRPALWKEITGRELGELGRDWRKSLETRIELEKKPDASPGR